MDKRVSERDWLPLGFLMFGACVGALTLAATVLIRLELQRPGIQYLVDAAGDPNGALYLKLVALHGPTTVLFVMLPMLFAGLGYKFVPEALGVQRTRWRALGWIGLASLCAGFVCLILMLFNGSADAQRMAFEGILYPLLRSFQGEELTGAGLVILSVGLVFFALFLVFVDFCVTLIAAGRAAVTRKSAPAWAYVVAGGAIQLVALAIFVPEVSGMSGVIAAALMTPVDLVLLVASIAVAVSSLWLSFYRGRGFWIVPVLWVVLFGVMLAYGRLTSLTLSQAGVDRALHDTYYVVAHTHALVQTASIFALSAGLFTAFVSIGRQVKLGALQASMMAVGTAMTFLPQVNLGLMGMPRRYIDYPDAFESWNRISSYGSFLTALAMCLWIVILLRARFGTIPDRARMH